MRDLGTHFCLETLPASRSKSRHASLGGGVARALVYLTLPVSRSGGGLGYTSGEEPAGTPVLEPRRE